jgi:hypothetical protein
MHGQQTATFGTPKANSVYDVFFRRDNDHRRRRPDPVF